MAVSNLRSVSLPIGMAAFIGSAFIGLGTMGGCSGDPNPSASTEGSASGTGGSATASSASGDSSSGSGGAGASTSASASSSGSGGSGVTGSPGCGKAPSVETGKFVYEDMMVGGATRKYAIRFPNEYDPKKPYPLVMLFHGCGGIDNNVPIEKESQNDAVLVKGAAMESCWDTALDSPDLAFFDELLTLVEDRACIDSSRVFGVGYSSGSWLLNVLGCVRAGVVRAQGNVSGGLPFVQNCEGNIAGIFLHDKDDKSNGIQGGINARDRLLTVNGCGMDTVPLDPAPCVQYEGCQAGYPVAWCQTSGKDHSRQDDFAPGAFWKFFSSLP
jgi:polyhydroxybutyrate depolymerase